MGGGVAHVRRDSAPTDGSQEPQKGRGAGNRGSAFLIAQDEAVTHLPEHEFIQQLMDFKLVHVIEPDTSVGLRTPGSVRGIYPGLRSVHGASAQRYRARGVLEDR